ncbi:TetR/AcrR family transcriptional regulator [Candidatus Binatus sp.]|uniref:TetR/AcrR family transcriptional regulator n=1 Tax=Candidatus Binatus sp. TaxID=2811406 RepID=UPI003C5C972F
MSLAGSGAPDGQSNSSQKQPRCDVNTAQRQAKAGRGRPRDAAADKAILRAALELFIEHGIEGASFEQIARRAGVARTTVYRRWSGREDLLAQAMEVAREAPERSLTAAARVPPKRMVDELIDALSEMATRRDYLRTVAKLVGSVPDSPKLMSVYWKTYLIPRRAMVAEIIGRARERGAIPKGTDSEILQDMIGGAIMYHLLIRPGRKNRKEMRAYIRRLLHHAGLTEG